MSNDFGFVKVLPLSFDLSLGDVMKNAAGITEKITAAAETHVKIIVFPELSLCGGTLGHLFHQKGVLDGTLSALSEIVKKTEGCDIVAALGLPLMVDGKLYNACAVFSRGKILGVVPKTCEDGGVFTSAIYNTSPFVTIDYTQIPFGTDMIFECENMPGLSFAVEIGGDLTLPVSPAVNYALNGAGIILNPAMYQKTIGNEEYITASLQASSSRLSCTYVYAGGSPGESTSDAVYGGLPLTFETGKLLGRGACDVDTGRIAYERAARKTPAFPFAPCRKIYFNFENTVSPVTRTFSKTPFVPDNETELHARAAFILDTCAEGLKSRLTHIKSNKIVLALSGGIDSTLALLTACECVRKMGLDHSHIITLSMPGFGTSKRTAENAGKLASKLGTNHREIPISPACERHFIDIGHDVNIKDTTYENAQARERTQIGMDIANQVSGLFIGTGDFSEACLGFTTYNGDHMSMYSVNSNIPKTLIPHIISYAGGLSPYDCIKETLDDIIKTPISPELLPADGLGAAQKTEDIIGPYILHDFFAFYFLRYGFTPQKILFMAERAFSDEFAQDEIQKWLKVFLKAFFASQFKRSCAPDGVKIGSVSLSPRSSLSVPSDVKDVIWTGEL